MNKKMGIIGALTVLGGALYGAIAPKTVAQAEPQTSPPAAKKRAPAFKRKPPTWNGLNASPPLLTTLELKALPPGTIPMQFNGGPVYWIPLHEKAPVKTKTRARKASKFSSANFAR